MGEFLGCCLSSLISQALAQPVCPLLIHLFFNFLQHSPPLSSARSCGTRCSRSCFSCLHAALLVLLALPELFSPLLERLFPCGRSPLVLALTQTTWRRTMTLYSSAGTACVRPRRAPLGAASTEKCGCPLASFYWMIISIPDGTFRFVQM